MISTGDVQGCLRKLETLLRVIKYPGCVDYSGLSKGDPSAFLQIVSFTLTSFSPAFAEELMAAGLELTGKTDLRFTETLYKVLRDIFHYKPILTKQQFLQWGFSQRKISFICDVINLVLQKHNQLKKLRIRCLALHQHGKREAYPALTDGDTVSERLIDVSGTRNPPAFPRNSSYAEAFSSDNVTCFSLNEVHSSASPEIGITDLAGGDEDKDNILQTSICQSSDLEGRLSALEAQLEILQSRLDSLSTLEKPLEEVERKKNTDKNEGQVITICRESWENLISRVILLETKLALSNAQLTVPVPCLSCTSAHSFGSMSDTSKDDFKGKLESITNILRSTSSLLKNTEYDATSDK